MRNAEELIREGQFEKAIETLSTFLKTENQNAEAHNLLGIALTGKRDLNSANLEYRKALRIEPNFVPSIKNLAINELTQGAESAAVRHFSAAMKLAPTDPVIHAYLGKIAFSHHEFRSAADHLEKTKDLLLDPTVSSALVESDLELGDRDKARSALGVLDRNRLSTQWQFRFGLILAQHEMFLDAIPFFQNVVSQNPDSEDAAYNLAACYLETKQFGQASTVLRTAAEHRNSPDILNLLADAYEANGQTQKAIDALREAVQVSPQDEQSYVRLVALCTKYEAYDLALKFADAGIQIHPHSDKLIFQRGVVQFMRGRPEIAEQDFELARQLAPEEDLNYAALGFSFVETRNPQALSELRERIRSRPDDFTLQYTLGDTLLRSNATPNTPEFSEAKHALETAVTLNPNSSVSQLDLGRIYLMENDLPRAVEHLERARTLDPKNRAAYAQLGSAYRRQGKKEEAKAMMSMVAELNEEEDSAEKFKVRHKFVLRTDVPNEVKH